MEPATERQRKSSSWTLLLYVVAAPVYVVRGLVALFRLCRIRRLSRHGYVECPHCGEINGLDILGNCPKCHTIEFGNRLRCGGCGTVVSAFPCEHCGVAIQIL